MKLGVLYSGGKDSTLALAKALETDEVVCLIVLLSKNKESYMFHTPNIELTSLQAEAMGLPIIQVTTEGEKETELDDLRKAILQAKAKYGIEGVVTGAVESVYQASRVQRICASFGLWCFNPLWKKDQLELLKEVSNEFVALITGVFAYPLDESWIGRKISREVIEELSELQKKFELNPAGEGGEFESTVIDAPFFKKRIEIKESQKLWDKDSGVYVIKQAELVEK